MAQLIVRQIEDRVVRKLKERTGRHGDSLFERMPDRGRRVDV